MGLCLHFSDRELVRIVVAVGAALRAEFHENCGSRARDLVIGEGREFRIRCELDRILRPDVRSRVPRKCIRVISVFPRGISRHYPLIGTPRTGELGWNSGGLPVSGS